MLFQWTASEIDAMKWDIMPFVPFTTNGNLNEQKKTEKKKKKEIRRKHTQESVYHKSLSAHNLPKYPSILVKTIWNKPK